MFCLLEVLYISTTQKVRKGCIEKVKAGLIHFCSLDNHCQDWFLSG
jgi:hypothetical protein